MSTRQSRTNLRLERVDSGRIVDDRPSVSIPAITRDTFRVLVLKLTLKIPTGPVEGIVSDKAYGWRASIAPDEKIAHRHLFLPPIRHALLKFSLLCSGCRQTRYKHETFWLDAE